MHRAPILASVAAVALLGVCSTAAAQQGQDLDKMLNSIPTVQTQPDPAAAAAAEEEARRKADEEGSLPAYVEACQKLAFDANMLKQYGYETEHTRRSAEPATRRRLCAALRAAPVGW
jgi:RecB family exonuclease